MKKLSDAEMLICQPYRSPNIMLVEAERTALRLGVLSNVNASGMPWRLAVFTFVDGVYNEIHVIEFWPSTITGKRCFYWDRSIDRDKANTREETKLRLEKMGFDASIVDRVFPRY